MGRPESPVDLASPSAQLACALRELRGAAGLTYAQLATMTYFSVATLSRAASGKGRPPWRVVRAFVAACYAPGCAVDWCAWKQLWSGASAEVLVDE